ncbi:MAG: hypothetical protein LBM70_08340 [Victivallales bacterium]|jgi:Na+/proline symporter|nr:hypothetical protein [Victivallales bacterium]
MSYYNWLIVIIPFLFVIGMAIYARKYIRDVVDYLSAGRVCGRYVIAVAGLESGLGLIVLVAMVELYYNAGFAYGFWNAVVAPLAMVLSLTGFFTYRFRETRAMTIGEYFEKRYSHSFRVFASFLRVFSEILTNTIGPAVAARFFIYLFGWPNTFNLLGIQISTFVCIMLLTLLFAMLVIWSGGMISLVVTDALQAIMSYPIFVVLTVFILCTFSWSDEIIPTLSNRVPGESFLNPFDISELRDFNLFAVIVTVFGTVLNRGVWSGGGSDTAAKTAHEGKMAGILGAWRNGFSAVMLMLLAVAVITVMNNANFVTKAHKIRISLTEQILEEKQYAPELRGKIINVMNTIPTPKHIPVQSGKNNQDKQYINATRQILTQEMGESEGNAAILEFQSLFNQMRFPVVLRYIFPGPILALMTLLALLLMLSCDDSRLFSSARTLAQDVIMPFIKKEPTVKQQLWLIRYMTLFVGLVFFIGSIFLSQLDYIQLYCTIMGAIWVGGAGAVTLGGLYTRFGTTQGAYASLFTGAFIAIGGALIQRNWPDYVYPFLLDIGWVEPIDQILRTVASPFVPYIRWEMNPVKFPINSMELFFIAMICSVLAYCLVSFLTCRKPYNLDKLLYRGKYNVEHKNEQKTKWSYRSFVSKIIGITPEYTKMDKVIAWSVFFYSFVYSFGLVFLGVIVWNYFYKWPERYWGYNFFITTLVVPAIIGVASTVWFMWGGIRDIRQLFKDLARRKANPEDNGIVKNENP